MLLLEGSTWLHACLGGTAGEKRAEKSASSPESRFPRIELYFSNLHQLLLRLLPNQQDSSRPLQSDRVDQLVYSWCWRINRKWFSKLVKKRSKGEGTTI
jgi:hypothetical protein